MYQCATDVEVATPRYPYTSTFSSKQCRRWTTTRGILGIGGRLYSSSVRNALIFLVVQSKGYISDAVNCVRCKPN